MRPIRTALTCSCCPIFWGSSSFPLKRKTVLRAITLRSGTCDSVLIRLSVRPSLRYSLFASVVAFTKGSTASESIFFAGRIAAQPVHRRGYRRNDHDRSHTEVPEACAIGRAIAAGICSPKVRAA